MYICKFPDCTYTTKDRNTIDYHHIIPKELNGKDGANNRISLCPTHHRMIFVPNAKTGLHSIKTKNSIIIKNILYSTIGAVLHYIDCKDDKEYIWSYDSKDKIII